MEELVRENELMDKHSEGYNKNVMAQIRKNSLLEGVFEPEYTGKTQNVGGESYKVIDNFVTPDMENLSQFGIAPAG